MKTKIKIIGVSAEIRTVNLLHTSPDRYRYATLLGGISYYKYIII